MDSITPQQLIKNISPKDCKSLFKTRPIIHAMELIFNWLIIIGTIVLTELSNTNWLYPIAVLLIGARTHALTVLMHDAAHYRFIKNKKWSDLITNIFTMYPIFTSIENYRYNHLKHHQNLNTEHDPDWVAKLTKREFTFPKTKVEFLWTVASYLFLYQGLLDAIWFAKRYNSKEFKNQVKSKVHISKIAFYFVGIGIVTMTGGWAIFLFYWIVPYLTSFFMFQYIRSVAEHYGDLAYEDEFTSSRTIKPNWLERFFLAPHHVGYHLEHHLYPGVPFYNLPRLHQLLMQQTEYRQNAHITNGYTIGLLQELSEYSTNKISPYKIQITNS